MIRIIRKRNISNHSLCPMHISSSSNMHLSTDLIQHKLPQDNGESRKSLDDLAHTWTLIGMTENCLQLSTPLLSTHNTCNGLLKFMISIHDTAWQYPVDLFGTNCHWCVAKLDHHWCRCHCLFGKISWSEAVLIYYQYNLQKSYNQYEKG